MKLLRKLCWLVIGCAALVALGWVSAWATGGWFVTPLVYGSRDPEPASARRYLEATGSVVTTTTSDGVELTGVFVASDPGAPVVLHFMESGVALADSRRPRGSFAELSAAGFASAAFDYRGVGLSERGVDASALLRDAEAMWSFAVEAAGGDPSLVILRGCSLGSIAETLLLEAGYRPGALMAVAPVEATTVADRYGRLFAWSPVVGLVSPFLRPVTQASTVQTFIESGVPALVQVHPGDALLDEEEYQRWMDFGGRGDSGTAPERQLWVRDDLQIRHRASISGLETHLNLAMQSHEISAAELAFLRGARPDFSPVQRRMEALIARADPVLVAEVVADKAAYRRVESLVAWVADAPANAALVAAQEFTDEEFEASHPWIRGPWQALPQGPVAFTGCFVSSSAALPPPGPDDLSVEELRKIFDLSHGVARLPVRALTDTRLHLWLAQPGKTGRAWTLERLETLRAALARDFDHPNVWEEPDPKAKPDLEWDPSSQRDHVVVVKMLDGRVRPQLRVMGDYGVEGWSLELPRIGKALGLEDGTWAAPSAEEIDLVIRCIRQACWITE